MVRQAGKDSGPPHPRRGRATVAPCTPDPTPLDVVRKRESSGAFGGSQSDPLTSPRSRKPFSTSGANAEAELEKGARAEIVTAYTMQLKREIGLPKGPLWDKRCSWSILIGLVIWALVAAVIVFLYHHRATSGHVGLHVRRGGMKDDGHAENGGRDEKEVLTENDLVLPEGCRGAFCLEGGGEDFGVILGEHNGVYAFSNCFSSTCVSLMENSIQVAIPVRPAHAANRNKKAAGTFRTVVTGMKWQCVEYARRYWLLRGKPVPAAFGSVRDAHEMWTDLSHVTQLDGAETPVLKFPNGLSVRSGGSPPMERDLLLYLRDEDRGVPYGHVAVIVSVDYADGVVYLAEQNWWAAKWPGPYHNYSRHVKLRVEQDEAGSSRYTIEDGSYVIGGWMRYLGGGRSGQ